MTTNKNQIQNEQRRINAKQARVMPCQCIASPFIILTKLLVVTVYRKVSTDENRSLASLKNHTMKFLVGFIINNVGFKIAENDMNNL